MSTPDADELLRQEVAKLAERDDCVWAGIYFVEGHELVLGPEVGTPDLERRVGVPVTWRGERIAELVADGAVDPAELERMAAGIADLCLVGWDTGGLAWES
jgi:putative methionine-R-sulfoxide reductase with GAF domain